MSDTAAEPAAPTAPVTGTGITGAGAPARPRRDRPAGAAALGAGLLVAAALPPWGWWPLAFVGIAILDALVAGRPARSRAGRGFLFGLGWLAPGMGWMWFLTAPGYVFTSLLFAAFVAGAMAVVPPGRGRRIALVGALALAQAVRLRWPFGGVPLATIAVGQAAGPLRFAARIGGVLAVSMVATAMAMCVAAAWRRQRSTLVWAVAAVAVVAVAIAAPHGQDRADRLVAVVQGGGPQATHAVDSDPREVFDRHLTATRAIPAGTGIDLVVWPENVIAVDDFASSTEREELAVEAERLGVPLAVGVTEYISDTRFLNAQVVVNPDGSLGSRYDKVRRVPFGEFMPLRSFLKALGAPVDLVPRDAVAGRNPAELQVPAPVLAGAGGGAGGSAAVAPPGGFSVGVVISWEVFFGDRARSAVGGGGELLLNPTNGSSYTGTILQSQQVASSKLRALETGRWVVQAAPTGFSAFVSPDGVAHQRTAQKVAATIERRLPLRTGRTPYQVLGDWPPLLVALGLVVAGHSSARRRPVVVVAVADEFL
jgi:apolipoprotein N-acyltransferase